MTEYHDHGVSFTAAARGVCVLQLLLVLIAGFCQARVSLPNSGVSSPSWMTSPLFHSPEVFAADYREMKSKFKVYMYPFEANVTQYMFNYADEGPTGPIPDGNYASEFYMFRNLYESGYMTNNPEEADLFVLPFSVFKLRMRLGPPNVAPYVKYYMEEVIIKQFPYWNRTGGADHFYATCHDLGSQASGQVGALNKNAIQAVCPSSIWLRTYIPHKDMSYPQIWPHPKSPPGGFGPRERTILAFWSGSQNSRVRAYVTKVWEEDEDILIGGGKVLRNKIRGGDYFENFRKSKYCLHITGYQVPTARIGDAIRFGCVPVIISDQYDLPFNRILKWTEFAVVLTEHDIPKLKEILKSADYPRLYKNVLTVRRFFTWNEKPQDYDLFNMVMYELWLRRFVLRPALDM